MSVASVVAFVGSKWTLVVSGARLYALGQAAVLTITALLSWRSLTEPAAIMHVERPGIDVAAWRNPWSGTPGSLLALAAAVSIVGALWLIKAGAERSSASDKAGAERSSASDKDRTLARAGHVLLIGWGLFWVVGASRASDASPDALFVTAQVLCLLGFLCQVLVSWRSWPRRKESSEPTPAPPASPL